MCVNSLLLLFVFCSLFTNTWSSPIHVTFICIIYLSMFFSLSATFCSYSRYYDRSTFLCTISSLYSDQTVALWLFSTNLIGKLFLSQNWYNLTLCAFEIKRNYNTKLCILKAYEIHRECHDQNGTRFQKWVSLLFNLLSFKNRNAQNRSSALGEHVFRSIQLPGSLRG